VIETDHPRQLGVVGLGVMGRNLALNAADHGWSVTGFDRDPGKTDRFSEGSPRLRGAASIVELAASLERPRVILLMVPAGDPVDAVINEVTPHLAAGDLLVDGGNSYFRDTERRQASLAGDDLQYLGLGISGGESGARHGPSLMPGGAKDAYRRVEALLAAIAARVDGSPCVAYLGPGGAGHYVKMVHNGIEYAVMQLISESYDLMRRGLGLGDDEIRAVYEGWDRGELRSYLLEITARILAVIDQRTAQPLVHVIADSAGHKGTGMWCSRDALELGVPVPTIDAAVRAREISTMRDERRAGARVLGTPVDAADLDRNAVLARLRGAYELGIIVAYGQGMAQLGQASVAYGFELDLAGVARIWRGGCIIRAALLERIRAAYQRDRELPNLLLDPDTSALATRRIADLRAIVREAAARGIPAPGLMSALAYVDALRSARLPANLIQAQRDYFGAHGFERTDASGTFHGDWPED
jgi:6-phosphogluconate dehydrogenase